MAGRGGGSVSRGLAQVADPASVGHIQWGDSLAWGEWIVREAFTVSQCDHNIVDLGPEGNVDEMNASYQNETKVKVSV